MVDKDRQFGKAYDVLVRGEYRTLLDCVNGNKLREAIQEIPEKYREYSDGRLAYEIQVTQTDWALRISFWREFERCMEQGCKMTDKRIWGGVCTETYYYTYFLNNPLRVAWMIRPLPEYKKALETLLTIGNLRRFEILDKTATDPKWAEVQRKTIKDIEDRVYGMAVQRLESKALQLNVNARNVTDISGMTMEQLEQKKRELLGEVNGKKENTNEGSSKPDSSEDQHSDNNDVIEAKVVV